MTVAPYDVNVDGHGYMLDLGSQQWKHESIQLLRPSFVTADRLGENDINPEALWRFSDKDWSHGAGQRRSDLPDSDTSRFWRSRGVDVWTKWQVSLLHALASSAGNLGNRMFVVGGHLYIQDNNTGTGLTFDSSNTVVSGFSIYAATDGTVVYYSDTAGIYSKAVGATGAGSSYNGLTGIHQLFYLNGRLLGVGTTNIFDIQASPDYDDLGALPGGFIPVDMTAGVQAIYVAAVNTAKGLSQVFKITIKDDGTGLEPPVAVTPPFDGTLRRILYYEGVVVFGQKEGVRMAIPSSDASLSIGPLIMTGNCSALTGHNGQIWFGIDQYELDGTGTYYWSGTGRLDPAVINDDGAPAWATDVMADGFSFSSSPQVLDACWDTAGFLYVLTTAGVYVRDTANLVAEGYIDSGLISYDLADDKTARYLTVRAASTSAGDITASLAEDASGTFTDVGTLPSGETLERFPIEGTPVAGEFEIRETLKRNAVSTTTGAVLTRHMLEADPVVASGFFLYVPLLICDPVLDRNQNDTKVDVVAERAYLYGLREGGNVVTYSELGYPAVEATVEDVQWLPTHRTQDNNGANGTVLLKLKTV